MTNLAESAEWVGGVYQIETSDPVLGGADGIANKQAIALAKRTAFLKAANDEFIGRPFWHLGSTPPPNSLVFNGAELNRADYPVLWAHISNPANNFEFVTDAQWHAGRGGCWSTGNGTTTFRVPEVRGDFLRALDSGRGIDAGRAVGSQQGHLLGSHRHTAIEWRPTGHDSTGGTHPVMADSSGSQGSRRYITEHSGGAETRPRNIAWLLCFKYQ